MKKLVSLIIVIMASYVGTNVPIIYLHYCNWIVNLILTNIKVRRVVMWWNIFCCRNKYIKKSIFNFASKIKLNASTQLNVALVTLL